MPPDERQDDDKLSKRLTRGAPLGAIVLIVLVVGLFLAYKLIFILELIAVAALLALVIRTVVDGLERIGFPPWLAVVTILVAIAAFGALVWYVLLPNVLQETQKVLLSTGHGSFQQRIHRLTSHATHFLRGLPFISSNFVSQLPQRLKGAFSGLLGSLPTSLPNSLPALASNFSSVLVGIIAVVFLSIYFAVSPGTYVASVMSLVPEGRRERTRKFIDRLERRLRAWILGTIIVAFVMGVGAGIGLWIIGIPLPLTFGLIVGVLSILPFIGSAVGGLFPGLLALTISPTKAILVGVLFFILAQADGNVLRPLIFGREVEVPPGWVLVSILILGVLLGPIIGAFLAVPVAVVLQVVVEELTGETPSSRDTAKEDPPSDDPHT